MAPPEPAPTQVRSPVAAGQVVDRKYRVEGVLGAGGMGIVVSATHLALDEPVALKFMTLDEGRGDDTSRARFLREAKAVRKLTSAHVARVFDVGQLPTGEPYIVMELLKGDDLAKHLRTQGRLSAADTVRFMLQVCDAIREAHALGIIHRDLKPQNLFLATRPGGGTIVKVLDFGIAKSVESASGGGASLTTSQNVVGSPIYMSPEQLRASKHVDGRTDIWSLGVIMFELLSGKVPFVGDSVLELGMRIMTVPAPSLTELRAEVPAALADVVQRCLEKEPDKRFPDIDSLTDALKPFVDVSHRSLPFADTLAEASSGEAPFSAAPEQVRTGGEFAGTNGGGITTKQGRPWTWGAIGAASVAIAVAAAVWHYEAPVKPAPVAAAPPAPTTFHVAVHTSPATAHVRFDGEEASAAPFIRDLPLDGQPHMLVVEAEGYEPRETTFRDAPPPPELTLRPRWQPAPTASTPPVPSSPPPPPEVGSPRREPRPRPAIAAQTSTPAVPSATAAPPKTTNDAPILR